MIDGRRIFVKQVLNSRERTQDNVRNCTNLVRDKRTIDDSWDDRSYKDVLLGATFPNNKAGFDLGVGIKEVFKASLKEVNFKIDLPKSEMEWLHRSALGRVHGFVSLLELQQAFGKLKVECSISPMDGTLFLVTFKSYEEMKFLLENNKLCTQELFEIIEPWNFSSNQRELAMWISLEEVSLVVWNEKFFQSLGNSWGTFVRLDKNTLKRRRFDVAKILLLIETRMNVPSSISVNIRGQFFKILVSIDECQYDPSSPLEVSSPEV
ncbi:hypothetical protein REPUB_Repub15cG0145100 [Reevesia pubescens]